MGLISFVKSAGEKLFGASEAKAATADDLHKELVKHGLDTSGVKITVDGDKVHVTGSAAEHGTGGKDRHRARQHRWRADGAERHQAHDRGTGVEVLYRQERRHLVGDF